MMADNVTDFSWTNKDAVAVRQQDAIAIYENPDGDMVIRRRRDWNEEDDVWIVIARDQVRTVMQAMEKVLADLEADGDE
jgi:hypothetical protein